MRRVAPSHTTHTQGAPHDAVSCEPSRPHARCPVHVHLQSALRRVTQSRAGQVTRRGMRLANRHVACTPPCGIAWPAMRHSLACHAA
eukprot:354901-Chlamydomonas_euryale.AAC.3